MNWDTEEAVRWFLNYQYLYLRRKSGRSVLKDLFNECVPAGTVDLRKVSWTQVRNFLQGED